MQYSKALHNQKILLHYYINYYNYSVHVYYLFKTAHTVCEELTLYLSSCMQTTVIKLLKFMEISNCFKEVAFFSKCFLWLFWFLFFRRLLNIMRICYNRPLELKHWRVSFLQYIYLKKNTIICYIYKPNGTFLFLKQMRTSAIHFI